MELFSIVITFGIFVIVWNSKKFLYNNYLLFVGIAYFFVAILDLFHTLAYKGMGIFTNFTGADLATQLWISARYLQSISLILALFFITRKLNYKIQFICYLIATTLVLLSIFYWRIFPTTYIEGTGLTIFKIASEYIISFMLAVAIFFLHLYRKEFSQIVFMLIISSLFITILSELSFTLYVDVYGLFNQLGHFFKLLSFFLIYKAIVEIGFSQPFELLFFKLSEREKDLKESEEKFRTLYFSMSEGVCLHEIIYDESKRPVDYRIIDINDAYLSGLGFKRDQIINKKVSEVYKTDIDPYISIYAQVADSGKPARFEAYFPSLKKYFLISVFSPSTGRIATMFSDITSRKRSEEKIRSLSRFPSDSPNPIIRMTDKNLIIYANKPARNILKQLDSKKKSKLLKFLHNSATVRKKNENANLQPAEIKIGKSFYEFVIVQIKGLDYYSVYGRDITSVKKAERLRDRIEKAKILDKERNKLARELHDTVTQTLFSANLTAEVIPKLWEKNPEAVIEKLESVRKLNKVALQEMRILLYELKPSALKNENLVDLLQGLIKSVESRSKIPIELIINGEYKFPAKIELGFFRIAQEGLNNIVKHSCATKASLVLKILPEQLYMIISDNGRGFDDKKIISTNLGLVIIRERAKLIGASISIKSLKGKGTNITVIYNNNKQPKSES